MTSPVADRCEELSDFPSATSDGRVKCQTCGRFFAMDRVGKHQAICSRIARKGPRKKFAVQRSYHEGGSEGPVIGIAKVGQSPIGSKGFTGTPRSGWREKSAYFQEAC